jgi:hypothetical protein
MSYGDSHDERPSRGVPMWQGSGGADRMPPQNIEAEKGVLGSIMLEDTVLSEVVEFLRPEHFWRDAHQIIYAAMLAVYNRGTAVDALLLSQELQERGQFETIGGEDYLTEIVQMVPHSANGKYYAGIVLETFERRQMIEVANAIIRDGYSGQYNAFDLRERVNATMGELEAVIPEEEIEGSLHPLPERMKPEAFRGIIGEIVRRIEKDTEACPEAILGQFLVAFASRVGSRPRWRHDFSVVGCNLFLTLVGPTGCGKQMSWKATSWLLGRADPTWDPKTVRKGLTSGEGLITALKNQGGSVLCVIPEFGELLSNMKRDKSNLSHVIRDAFDGGSLQVQRSKDPLEIDDAFVNLIAHATSTDLKRGITADEISNGFANRWINLHAYQARSLPFGGNFDAIVAALDPIIGLLYDALDFARTHTCFNWPISMDDQAKELWQSVYDGLRNRPETAHGMVTKRAAPIVMKLALLYAILDLSQAIRLPHLEAALAFWEYGDQTARHFFGDAAVDAKLAKLEELLADSATGLTRTDINRMLWRGRLTSSELDVVIQSALGTGRYVYRSHATRGALRRALVHKRFSV